MFDFHHHRRLTDSVSVTRNIWRKIFVGGKKWKFDQTFVYFSLQSWKKRFVIENLFSKGSKIWTLLVLAQIFFEMLIGFICWLLYLTLNLARFCHYIQIVRRPIRYWYLEKVKMWLLNVGGQRHEKSPRRNWLKENLSIINCTESFKD